MDEKVIAAILATERKYSAALSEVMELTEELDDALQRQDQVAVRMFLSMRQEPINQLREYRGLQRKRCAAMPDQEGEALWQVLTGEREGEGSPQFQPLERLAGQNKKLLERIQQKDRQISVKMGGKKSFYSQQKASNK